MPKSKKEPANPPISEGKRNKSKTNFWETVNRANLILAIVTVLLSVGTILFTIAWYGGENSHRFNVLEKDLQDHKKDFDKATEMALPLYELTRDNKRNLDIIIEDIGELEAKMDKIILGVNLTNVRLTKIETILEGEETRFDKIEKRFKDWKDILNKKGIDVSQEEDTLDESTLASNP